jgi:hypothetical protein
MTGNFTVLTPEQEERLRKLEVFHTTIRELVLTSNLYYNTVEEALSKVDEKWRLADMGNLEERN